MHGTRSKGQERRSNTIMEGFETAIILRLSEWTDGQVKIAMLLTDMFNTFVFATKN